MIDGQSLSFFRESEFRIWLSAQQQGSRALYVCDYELSTSGPTGLDLIKEFGIAHQSVLVTNRSDDPSLIRNCEALGAKLLSKADFADVIIAPAER